MSSNFCLNDSLWECEKLHWQCLAFSFYGATKLKKLFKENKIKGSIQVKKFKLGSDNNSIVDHYIIEIKINNKKLIIDNIGSYGYYDYMANYVEQKTIEKIKCNDIKQFIKNDVCHIEDDIDYIISIYFAFIKSDIINNRFKDIVI